MLSVKKIEFDDWDLIVHFSDGVIKKIDIREWMKGFSQKDAKKIASDKNYFHKAKVEYGAAIAWPSGFAIEPDEIHERGEKVMKVAGKYVQASLINALKSLQ